MGKEARLVRRYKTLSHYSGGGVPKCDCCGESRLEFLALDHVKGGGNEHRRRIGKSTRLFDWLAVNGFPDGYRVLCHCCNMSIGFYGYCPHQAGEKLADRVNAYVNNPPRKGERHHAVKLTEAKVRVIKKRLQAGEGLSKIAREEGLCKATIGHIKSGRNWSHVAA